MNAIIRKRIAARKRHLQKRLDKNNYPDDLSRPVIRGSKPQFELAARGTGTGCGGIGLLHQLVRELGLAEVDLPKVGGEGGRVCYGASSCISKGVL